MAAAPPKAMAPGAGPAIRIYTVLTRTLATKGRLAALGFLGLGSILLGLAVRLGHELDRAQVAYSVVDGYGLALLVPVVALVFASATLGDPAEDGTLVYLWLRPLPRWQLSVAALAAALSVTVPVAVIPVVIGAAVSGGGSGLIWASAAGSLLEAVAYSAVFCGLGLRVRRALAWGLAYLLIWEQAVGRVSHGAARASLFINARSLVAYIADRPPPRNAVAPATAVILLLVVSGVAVLLTTRSLNRGEVT